MTGAASVPRTKSAVPIEAGLCTRQPQDSAWRELPAVACGLTQHIQSPYYPPIDVALLLG